MRQYFDIKSKHPDAILLFRVGDFYEMYGEDAVAGADILGIVQTKRANGATQYVKMANFPHHALDTYLPKLVRAGRRVAICDQLEDPKLTKNPESKLKHFHAGKSAVAQKVAHIVVEQRDRKSVV